eukprot:361093-Chlamydomonas_euryale.AAC.3
MAVAGSRSAACAHRMFRCPCDLKTVVKRIESNTYGTECLPGTPLQRHMVAPYACRSYCGEHNW